MVNWWKTKVDQVDIARGRCKTQGKVLSMRKLDMVAGNTGAREPRSENQKSETSKNIKIIKITEENKRLKTEELNKTNKIQTATGNNMIKNQEPDLINVGASAVKKVSR